MYTLINGSKETICTGFSRWTEGKEEVTIRDQEEWRDTCNSSFKASRETKLHSFHYKVLHRTFPCNAYLARLRVLESDWCLYCDETDSITHHLFRCAKVKPFWDSICRWFRQSVDLYLDQLTPKEYIFGLPKGSRHRNVINAILLAVKFYIFRQKRFHECQLELVHWLAEFKTKLQVETWIRARTNSKLLHVLFTRIKLALG